MALTQTHGSAVIGSSFITLIDSGTGSDLRYHGADIFLASPIPEGSTMQITILKYDPSSGALRVVDSRFKAASFFADGSVRCIGIPMIPTEQYRIRIRVINAGSSASHPVTWAHYEQEA